MIYLIVRNSDRAVIGSQTEVNPSGGYNFVMFTVYEWDNGPVAIHSPDDDPPIESFFTEAMAKESLEFAIERRLVLTDSAVLPPGQGGYSGADKAKLNQYRRDVQVVTDFWNPIFPDRPNVKRVEID